jgi:predicted RNase H-like HicB family nuclease
MLMSYIEGAMRHADFERMEDGRWFGSIPLCPGLWADGDTRELCRSQLESALEDWILIKVRHGDTMPVIDGLDINPKPLYAEAD